MLTRAGVDLDGVESILTVSESILTVSESILTVSESMLTHVGVDLDGV